MGFSNRWEANNAPVDWIGFRLLRAGSAAAGGAEHGAVECETFLSGFRRAHTHTLPCPLGGGPPWDLIVRAAPPSRPPSADRRCACTPLTRAFPGNHQRQTKTPAQAGAFFVSLMQT